MDPKAPRTATASLVLGVVSCVLSLFSVIFNFGLTPGFSSEEILLLVIGAFFFLICFFASREREQIGMIESLSSEEKFAEIESLPTKFKSSTTITDQYGLETQKSPESNSQAIINSILGQKEESNLEDVSSAMAALSFGKDGDVGAEAVRNNPAPHAQTEQFREVFKTSNTTKEGFARIKIENIPLPGEKTARATPDLPWFDPKHEFQSSGVANIPLPGIVETKPKVEAITVENIPEMPNLDDLFAEQSQEIKSGTSLPDLPNLDDLF